MKRIVKKMVGLAVLLLLQSIAVLASEAQEAREAGVEEMAGFPGGKMPTAEELLSALDSMSGMSAEEKETLRQELMKNLKAEGGGQQAELIDEDGVPHIASSLFASQFFVLVAMLSVLALIFVFFGYKLYKSLTEREKRREEKKKSKQMKKKK